MVQTADGRDKVLLSITLDVPVAQLDKADLTTEVMAADKEYHSNEVVASPEKRGVRRTINEPECGYRNWKN